MIDESFLKNYAVKSKTIFQNVVREYFQHLFLSGFYRQSKSENFLFKGGTALRLVFGSPRFSEDLDFTGIVNSRSYEKILEEVLADLDREKTAPDLVESKKTSGGHLAIIEFLFLGEKFRLVTEVSFRQIKKAAKEPFLISSELTPSYSVYLLPKQILVAEKIQALMFRKKPRDVFDLYFILRNEQLRRELKLDKSQREELKKLLTILDKKKIETELKTLLPTDFWPIIKDLPGAILNQLSF